MIENETTAPAPKAESLDVSVAAEEVLTEEVESVGNQEVSPVDAPIEAVCEEVPCESVPESQVSESVEVEEAELPRELQQVSETAPESPTESESVEVAPEGE